VRLEWQKHQYNDRNCIIFCASGSSTTIFTIGTEAVLLCVGVLAVLLPLAVRRTLAEVLLRKAVAKADGFYRAQAHGGSGKGRFAHCKTAESGASSATGCSGKTARGASAAAKKPRPRFE